MHRIVASLHRCKKRDRLLVKMSALTPPRSSVASKSKPSAGTSAARMVKFDVE